MNDVEKLTKQICPKYNYTSSKETKEEVIRRL